MIDLGWILYVFVALVVLMVLSSAIKIVQEYERAGIFRLGRFVGLRGPGLVLIIPFVERARKVDLRVVTMDVPQQECITLDNVTVSVDAVIYFRVVEPADQSRRCWIMSRPHTCSHRQRCEVSSASQNLTKCCLTGSD